MKYTIVISVVVEQVVVDNTTQGFGARLEVPVDAASPDEAAKRVADVLASLVSPPLPPPQGKARLHAV